MRASLRRRPDGPKGVGTLVQSPPGEGRRCSSESSTHRAIMRGVPPPRSRRCSASRRPAHRRPSSGSGTHPGSPSRLVGREGTLADLVPDGLPFLLKVLAPAPPLSLQAHPSVAQARGRVRARGGGGHPDRRARAQLQGPQPQARDGLRADASRSGRSPGSGRSPRPAPCSTGRARRAAPLLDAADRRRRCATSSPGCSPGTPRSTT